MSAIKKSLRQADETKLLIRLPRELHKQLRQLAFELNLSMAELCREGIETILQKHQKKGSVKKL